MFGRDLGSSLAGIFGGLFGDYGEPYRRAGSELDKYFPQAQQWQQPFYQAGAAAIPQYQEWLAGMKDPSDFINNLMGQYEESPWSKYEQDQAMRAAQNAASRGDTAVGGLGSTPFAKFAAQQAAGISSRDMQNWLANVLGINTQYGQGQLGLAGIGQQAANNLSNLWSDYALSKAKLGYGEERAGQEQWGGLFRGLGGLAGLFF